jgi:hypothetical protein
MGGLVDVTDVTGDADEAEIKDIAARYIAALGHQPGVFIARMADPREMASLPPFGVQFVQKGPHSSSTRERELHAQAIRFARQSMLGDITTLSRAYDYVQDALAKIENGIQIPDLPSIYKAIEVIENHFGGERETLNALRVDRDEYKDAKRLANQSDRDERHAPKPSDTIKPVESRDRDRAVGVTRQLCAAFADYLLSTPAGASTRP